MRTRILLTVFAFAALTIIAAGQTAGGQTNVSAGQGKAQGAAWVDADNDGVCDNFENGTRPGRGQARGARAGKGTMARDGRGHGMGRRHSAGRGTGRGQGPAFVDVNKNGICDNQEKAAEIKK